MKKKLIFLIMVVVLFAGCSTANYNTKYDKAGYDETGYTGYDKYGYNKVGYNKEGFNAQGIHYKTKTKYNGKGYDRYGYNKDGYDENGYDTYGCKRYNRSGYNISGQHAKIDPSLTQEIYGSTKQSIDGTMVLYDQYNIQSAFGGRQISKSYYYKDSIKNINSDNQDIWEVKTYRKVTDEGGATIYLNTFHINCKTQKCTITRQWTTGFGEDKGLMVDGKWFPVSDFPDMSRLANIVCSSGVRLETCSKKSQKGWK